MSRPPLLIYCIVIALVVPGCGSSSGGPAHAAESQATSNPDRRGTDKYAGTLQDCIGFAKGQPWPKPAGPKPETMTSCQKLPEWTSYDKARQSFQTQDHAGAAKILLVAARAGNALAALRLAILYDNGDGVGLNKKEAFRWYLSAASGGEPAAAAEVGSFYEDGAVVPEDWIEAAKWYLESAQYGWPKGEFDLGRAYEYGIGVPLNLPVALHWYSRAAPQGNARAGQVATFLRQNHGIDASSMSDDEQAVYAQEVPGLRTLGHTVPPPGDRVFRNRAERMTFIRTGLRQILWNEYDACARNFSNVNRRCVPPLVPRPR
jgi:TPR repeat protein